MRANFRLFIALILLPMLASAQVFRCTDSAGKLQYSDRPCDGGQRSTEVRIQKQPAQRMSAGAAAHETARQDRRESSNASHQRIDEASATARDLKEANRNPAKCAEARRKMARMEQRDPMHKVNPDYFEFSQAANLYCGN